MNNGAKARISAKGIQLGGFGVHCEVSQLGIYSKSIRKF